MRAIGATPRIEAAARQLEIVLDTLASVRDEPDFEERARAAVAAGVERVLRGGRGGRDAPDAPRPVAYVDLGAAEDRAR